MRYLALATDYDGTLASSGKVEPETVAALEQLRAHGLRLLLVTGRRLEDLSHVFEPLELFDRVVAENGAVLHETATGRTRLLAEPPPQALVEALRARGVEPLGIGRVVVATWETHEREVLGCIRDLGLDLHVESNKGALMVLPAGITKASGLHAALQELALSEAQVVGVGDAENDETFLAACGFSVAVANALDSLKARVDWVTPSPHGRGVVELARRLCAEADEPEPEIHGGPRRGGEGEHRHR